MNKIFFLHLVLLVCFSTLKADNEFLPYRINFIFENDIYNQTDSDYSSGERLSALFYINNPTHYLFNILKVDKNVDTYINISLTNQIFTPTDIQSTQQIIGEHPYAGWSYVTVALQKCSYESLNSLSIKVGMVGPSSGAQQIQESVHRLTNSTIAMGWDNQLKDELGINLQYLHKQHIKLKNIYNIESSIVPFAELQLGNISINANGGVIMRFGWNIPRDFGFSNIVTGNEDGIPLYNERKHIKKSPWSFSINFTASATAVARDIFLDGNTFKDSYSVEKEYLIGRIGYGFSTRYKNFAFDFLGVISSKKFKTADKYHAVGTTKFAWLF